MKSGGEKGSDEPTPPKLAKRRANKNSPFRSGRTIGERREKLETASERSAAREKVKKKQKRRIVSTILIYIALGILTIVVGVKLFSHDERELPEPEIPIANVEPYAPTVEIIDEDASPAGSHLTGRMKEYIGQAEADFRELGYIPIKVVIPSGTIREVDFYLDGYSGFVKLITDRGTGVSTEDADRMIRYLASIGVNDFEYIDVRIDGKAYWK